MENFIVDLNRLHRHYVTSRNTYDKGTLLDLSHILRIWTEHKLEIPKHVKNANEMEPFKSETPTRKSLNIAGENEYIFSYFPGGVFTSANFGLGVCGGKMRLGGGATLFCKLQDYENGTRMLGLCYVATEEFDLKLSKKFNDTRLTRCTYTNWLSSEAIRVQFFNGKGNLVKRTISREILIKRVANILGGSHASFPATDEEGNKFNESVRWLMEFHCAGLPLPYFLLLKFAQDILEFMPPLLGLKVNTDE